MKKRLLKTCALLMALCTLSGASSLTSFAENASKTETTDNTVYYTDGKNRTGIKSIKSDGTLFYDCVDNNEVEVTSGFLYDLLTKPVSYQNIDSSTGKITLLSQWADIASATFENGGKYTSTHNYSDYYGKNHKNKSDEQCDVAALLASKGSKSCGSKKNDNYHTTGLSVATSFSELRNKMCNEISGRINRYTLEPENILSQGKNCTEALPELADDTERDIIYNMVTSITREGRTYKYQYNSYGLAFYDFDLKIIDDNKVQYVQDISKIDVGSSSEEIVSYTTNETYEDTTDTITTEISKTESVSTTMSKSESYSIDEMFGGQFMVGYDSFLRGVIESSLTYGEVYESTRTDETTEVSSVSQSKQVNCNIPAHTAVGSKQKVCEDEMTVSYDTPVALTFKVAVFSMSGDVYADSLATLAFSTAGYKQSNFSTFFGGDTAKEGFYAYDSLSNKVNNAGINGWDASYGNNHFFYKKHDGSSSATNTTAMSLDWNDIMNIYDKNTGSKDGIKNFANKCPMLPVGTTTTTTVQSINTTLSKPVPLYLPTVFRIANNTQKSFYLFTDGVFNLNTISVGAFDKDNVPYYEFLQSDGQWKVRDDGTSKDVIEFDPASYTVKAKGTGIGYLEWSLKPGVEYTALKEEGTVTCDNANSVVVAFVVREYPL